MRAARGEPEIRDAVGTLIMALCDGVDFGRARDRAWLLAESVRMAELDGTLPREAVLRCYDLLGACWALCERMELGWRRMDQAAPSQAMEAAGTASTHLDQLEGHPLASAGLVMRLRGRVQALWHVADAIDEAGYLAEGGDDAGARARGVQLLDQLEVLAERRALSPDEHDIAEACAARFGARPGVAHRGSWAS